MHPSGGWTRPEQQHGSSNWPITSPYSFTGTAEPIFNKGEGVWGLKTSAGVARGLEPSSPRKFLRSRGSDMVFSTFSMRYFLSKSFRQFLHKVVAL